MSSRDDIPVSTVRTAASSGECKNFAVEKDLRRKRELRSSIVQRKITVT